jgi:catechol 2,3-dioxygenase-like lactoylglutathione lyase family enzyme
MAEAMTHLQRFADWTAISQDGPERLPQSSGGVTAFKFRDPEGHPLEFLEFPAQPRSPAHGRKLFLDIDHSAISVANTQGSVAFYTALGLHVGATFLNAGIEQQRLDSVQDPEVEVTALQCATDAKPHIELLRYRGSYDRSGILAQPDDIASTRLVCTVQTLESIVAICQRLPGQVIRQDTATALLRDPDGHLIGIEHAASP